MGYVHDTNMSQYITPSMFHYVTGTWADAAGNVTGTIVKQKTAGAETSVVTIPIMIPSNSSALKGSMLESVEIDYEILTAAATSITAAVNKITSGADGAVAVKAAVTATQDLTAATDAADVDQHKLTVTITTPAYIDNGDYYFVELTCICAGTTVLEFLGAIANYTLRV
jgi:hypothetical protein